MQKRRRTEITIETETIVRVRGTPEPVLRFCGSCGTERWMVAPAAAAQLADLTTRAVYRLVESGRLHFEELAGCELLVCTDSLRRERDE